MDLYLGQLRFFRAALAPFLPRAVRVFFGRCATVLFRCAALAAFLMFRFAAARCFLIVILGSSAAYLTRRRCAYLLLSHLSQCLHLDVKSAQSCMKNRQKQETRSWAQFLRVGRADAVEHRSRTFRPLSLETSME